MIEVRKTEVFTKWLSGGDKSTQAKDISKAIQMSKNLEE